MTSKSLEAKQKRILKAIDKIPAFVINEGDIEIIRLSRFVDPKADLKKDPLHACRKFLVIKVAWD
tara:strand:- start:222 stop:416 length:195 start_codon:yes stop_codon:yes gene_type:complete